MRTHDCELFPWLVRRKHGLRTFSLPRFAIITGAEADPRLPFRLTGVPHAITIAVSNDDRPIDIAFPIGLAIRTKDDRGLAPFDSVFALDQRDALFRSPREPHSKAIVLLQNGDLKA